MPPDPPREQGPPGLATPTQINATPTSKTVENPDKIIEGNDRNYVINKLTCEIMENKPLGSQM